MNAVLIAVLKGDGLAAERTQREKIERAPVLEVGESHDSSHDSLRRPSTTRHSKLLSCLNG
jgi:hypothetical protein